MGRPEGETTRILRDSMELELEKVNTKLLDAGEKALDASTLAKRRSWIRTKDGKNSKRRVQVKKPSWKPASRKAATPTRKRQTPAEPREGTFAAFVWGQPYDMDVKELLKRAKAAGVEGGNSSQIYKIRAKYPKPVFSTPNQIATPAPSRAQAALLAQQPSLQSDSNLLALTPRDKTSARKEFAVMMMRLGLDESESILQDFRQKLQASLEGS